MENFESKLLEVTIDSMLRALKIFYDDYSRKLNDIEKTIFDDKNNVKENVSAETSMNYLYKRGVRDGFRACIEFIEEEKIVMAKEQNDLVRRSDLISYVCDWFNDCVDCPFLGCGGTSNVCQFKLVVNEVSAVDALEVV